MHRKQYIFLFSAIFSTLFYNGFFDAQSSVLLPDIKADFHISYTDTGFLFLLPILPGIIGPFIIGIIFNRFKSRFIFSLLCLFISLFGLCIAFSPLYNLFLLWSFLLSIVAFFITTGAHIFTSTIMLNDFPKHQTIGINALHLSFSLGAVLSLLIGKLFFFNQNWNWRSIYILLSFIPVILLFFFSLSVYPENITKQKKSVNVSDLVNLLKNKKMIKYALCSMLYAGGEVSLAKWLPAYLINGCHFTKQSSSNIFTLFLLLLAIGRLSGLFILKKIHPGKMVVILSFLTVLCIIVGVLFAGNMVFILALSGLFLTLIMPLIQTMLNNDFKDNINIATAIFVISTNIGISFFPFLIGVLNDIIGIRYGILFSAGYILLIFLIYFKKDKRTTNHIIAI